MKQSIPSACVRPLSPPVPAVQACLPPPSSVRAAASALRGKQAPRFQSLIPEFHRIRDVTSLDHLGPHKVLDTFNFMGTECGNVKYKVNFSRLSSSLVLCRRRRISNSRLFFASDFYGCVTCQTQTLNLTGSCFFPECAAKGEGRCSMEQYPPIPETPTPTRGL